MSTMWNREPFAEMSRCVQGPGAPMTASGVGSGTCYEPERSGEVSISTSNATTSSTAG